MKKTLVTIATGSLIFVSANQGYQPYGNTGNSGNTGYTSDNSSYYSDTNGRPVSSNQGSSYNQGTPYNQGPAYQVNVRRIDSGPQSQNFGYGQDQSYQQGYQNQAYNQQGNQNQGNYQDRQATNSGSNQSPVSDQELAKNIHDQLRSGWFSKGYKNVSFEVGSGNVTLNGTVDSLADKTKVEDTVRAIDGVRQITNQIAVATPSNANTNTTSNYRTTTTTTNSNTTTNPSYRNTNTDSDYYAEAPTQKRGTTQDFAATEKDRQINSDIRKNLNTGWFPKAYETLIIRTTNGVVILTGTVDDATEAQKITDNAKNVDGVVAVNNQLQIKK